MNLATVVRHVAIGNGAGGVDRFQRSALVDGGQAFRPSDIDGNAVTVEHHRDDVGLAGQSSGGLGGNIGSEVSTAGGVGVRTAGESGQIDVHHHFGALRTSDVVGGGRVVDECQQRVSATVIVGLDARCNVHRNVAIAGVKHALFLLFDQ